MRKKSPYERIMEASRKDQGVRLSGQEVDLLAMDAAIYTLAESDGQEALDWTSPRVEK